MTGCPAAPPSEFQRRHALWADFQVRFGPARSYPYAWRLPELARHEGPEARFRASLALAQTLYTMGRFGEALAALSSPDVAGDQRGQAEAHCLQAAILWITDDPDGARATWQQAVYPDALDGLLARADFHYLTGGAAPDTAIPDYQRASEGEGGIHAAWAVLLADWRTPAATQDLPRIHAALAWLRSHAPAHGARGEAVFAEARFREAPAAALVWLDQALASGEQFGQHHLKARLLHQKALSLAAAGQLAEADRFLEVARETALRQGAWRYLRAMAP